MGKETVTFRDSGMKLEKDKHQGSNRRNEILRSKGKKNISKKDSDKHRRVKIYRKTQEIKEKNNDM